MTDEVPDRASLVAEVSRLKAMLPPDSRDAGGPFVGQGNWAVFAEKVVAERDAIGERVKHLETLIVDWYSNDDGPSAAVPLDDEARAIIARKKQAGIPI